ncbi:MAG TPA: glycoside hydrolase family 9 protein [Rhodanobacteraceae bacterium]
MSKASLTAALGLALATPAFAATPPARILTNHLGYETAGPKLAIVQGHAGDDITACTLATYPDEQPQQTLKVSSPQSVRHWRDWRFWSLDFNGFDRDGRYVITCANKTDGKVATLTSFPFRIQHDIVERHTLSDVLAFFESERVSGAMDKADADIGFAGDPGKPHIDARGGWYDATGDYGVHFSQLDFSTWFNTQQVPLVVYAMGRSWELLKARGNSNFTQLERRLVAGATYGADFLVRMHPAGGSFYETLDAPGPHKKPQDRRIAPVMQKFAIKKNRNEAAEKIMMAHGHRYQVSFRSGGGFAVAALALAARLPWSGDFSRATYLKTAEDAFACLQKHNKALLNDGRDNILDDYSALLAASELLRTTHKAVYKAAAQKRADALMARLSSDAHYQHYWRRGGPGSGPFYHPSDAGSPVVALLDYYPQADAATQARIKQAVRRSLGFQLAITDDVVNPFGYARQYVQTKALGRQARFFFPHDTTAAPWWQGGNARIASLATAARLALPLFKNDAVFSQKLRAYATDQINWILGLNPFDASMLQGIGHNNPQYLFFDSWQYTERPGGIVNGITSAYATHDDTGIDYAVPYSQTHTDSSWRWEEQWLPHDAWYLLAAASRNAR